MQFAGNDAPQPERYVVLRALGKGSFGTVDLVRDLQDGGRLLALKTVRLPSGTLLPRGGVDGLGGSLDGPPSGVLKEVRLLKALRHPNIVRLCHAFIGDSGGGSGDGSARGGGDGGDGSGGVEGIMGGVGGGVTFVHIAMEYCDAGDLKQRINSRKMSGSHFSEWQVRLGLQLVVHATPPWASPSLYLHFCASPPCARPQQLRRAYRDIHPIHPHHSLHGCGESPYCHAHHCHTWVHTPRFSPTATRCVFSRLRVAAFRPQYHPYAPLPKHHPSATRFQHSVPAQSNSRDEASVGVHQLLSPPQPLPP